MHSWTSAKRLDLEADLGEIIWTQQEQLQLPYVAGLLNEPQSEPGRPDLMVGLISSSSGAFGSRGRAPGLRLRTPGVPHADPQSDKRSQGDRIGGPVRTYRRGHDPSHVKAPSRPGSPTAPTAR